ncbi:hypothetical protein TCDM_05953 [Trypanosoma cruzi Dm28c]|uniref:Mitochondrial carrier protein n=2 Tax=Trypanosoma cruzi TaxID=5693 RepID=V5DDT9_TRYCR|nr:hypothetical protein TCDM_05953 [Trypanosoma cruzi Dm28c]
MLLFLSLPVYIYILIFIYYLFSLFFQREEETMSVMAPLVDLAGGAVPYVKDTTERVPTSATSAVTRSWSHVDCVTLFATFAATSFAYSLVGHPLFLAVSRQQCSTTRLKVRQVLQEVYLQHGYRGLFRGAGVAVSGTVISELVYYLIVEYGKEHLPLPTKEQRCLTGGFAADLISGPIFNPFAVVSQVQMVADCRGGEHKYRNAFSTTKYILMEQGWRTLFRGTLLTMVVSPLTGAWWFVYELLKQRAYKIASRSAPLLGAVTPARVRQELPVTCTSTTDNLIVNCVVGALSSIIIGILMNPLYVLRLRLQVAKNLGSTRFPAIWMMRNVFREEGIQAFFKGLRANLFMAVIGGSAFGMTYEGAKQFSDITESGSFTLSTLEIGSR